MNSLAGTAPTAHEEAVRKEKPFTLWFEEICNLSNKSEPKRLIAELLSNDITQNDFHTDFMELDISNILTTNYDYNLEKSINLPWRPNSTAKETYYSLFRRNSIGKKHIWHIHGELNNISSIMLGHEQYAGYLYKMRNYLSSGVQTENKDRNQEPYLSKFRKKIKEQPAYVESWVDIFLESEIHIIGFSFDYTENHLWNLITEKNKLNKRGEKIGQAVFHRCSDKKQSTSDEARISILKSFGVKIYDHTEKSYEAAYNKCIQCLV